MSCNYFVVSRLVFRLVCMGDVDERCDVLIIRSSGMLLYQLLDFSS